MKANLECFNTETSLASDIVCWQNKQKKDLVYKKKTTTRHIWHYTLKKKKKKVSQEIKFLPHAKPAPPHTTVSIPQPLSTTPFCTIGWQAALCQAGTDVLQSTVHTQKGHSNQEAQVKRSPWKRHCLIQMKIIGSVCTFNILCPQTLQFSPRLFVPVAVCPDVSLVARADSRDLSTGLGTDCTNCTAIHPVLLAQLRTGRLSVCNTWSGISQADS